MAKIKISVDKNNSILIENLESGKKIGALKQLSILMDNKNCKFSITKNCVDKDSIDFGTNTHVDEIEWSGPIKGIDCEIEIDDEKLNCSNLL